MEPLALPVLEPEEQGTSPLGVVQIQDFFPGLKQDLESHEPGLDSNLASH